MALLVVAGALAYANSLSGAFVLDDQSTIVDNQTIREWWRPSVVLVPERNTAIAGRPIVNLSFAVNYAVGGLDARGYHLVNIALHIVCGLLAFGVIRRTLDLPRVRERVGGASVPIAFAAALLWLVHPLNSEVVDYLTERTESLMALAYLLTLYASVRALAAAGGLRSRADRGSRRRTRWATVAVVSCALGMACKESMVTAPVAVVLYDRIFVFGSLAAAMRARRWLYGGLAASWAVLAGLALSGPRSGVGGFSTGVPVWTWLLNQAEMIAHYLRLAFWPRSLVVFYGWPRSLLLADVLPYAILIALLLGATVAALVRWPEVGFLGAWFFLTLAPTSSFVPIATEVGAERRMYLPLIALAVGVVAGVHAVWSWVARSAHGPGILSVLRVRGGAAIGAVAIVLAAAPLTAATLARNREYESPVTLARTVVARRPSAVTRHYLAEQLSVAGRHEEAIGYLRDAVAGGDSRAGYLLGIELFNAGKLDDAVRALTAFVRTSQLSYRLVPHWLEPPVPEVVSARLILARAGLMQRRWPDTVSQAHAVLSIAPGNREAQLDLADALFAQQQYAEAAADYQTYLAKRPDDVHALTNFGVALVAGGRMDEAIAVFQRAVAVEPGNPDSRRILGLALMDRGDFEAAASQARQGLTANPGNDALRELLARAEAGSRSRR